METLRFKNYRCFEDTGDVEIRPITVLIGANSSGKSSFLKFFPLLKQSMGEMVNGVFLWAGQLVDMKNFENTVRSGQKELTIEYLIDELPLRAPTLSRRTFFKQVRIEMLIAKRDLMYDFMQKLRIKSSDFDLDIIYYPDNTAKVVINSIDSSDLKDEVHWSINNALIPKLIFGHSDDNIDENSLQARNELKKVLLEVGIKKEQLYYYYSPYRYNGFDVERIVTSIKEVDKTGKKTNQYKRIVDLLMYYNLNRLIDSINLYFMYLSKKMTYIMPLRAIAERYYRFQNYSVQEIDADGKNLPMFYSSLSDDAFENLNLWLHKIFGFTLELRTDGGHLEMLIKEEGQEEARNLADIGFGYTQVLPILTILWKVIMIDCIYGKDETQDYCKIHIVAIEQPELHLHPRYQGLFVDMMAKVIEYCKNNKKDIRIVIETHSEIIINRLGKLISNEKSRLDESDVNVVIFNGLKEKLKNYVVQTKFDNAGYIEDWPYGFFSDYVDRN